MAVVLYLTGTSQQITTQRFRLDFEGATTARYPDGSRFGIADIMSSPTLLRVYRDDHLSELISFGDFAHSVFVLESSDRLTASRGATDSRSPRVY